MSRNSGWSIGVVVATIVACFAVGCGDSGAGQSTSDAGDVSDRTCTEGRTMDCSCDDGASGVHTCLSDGTWGRCRCGTSGPDTGLPEPDTDEASRDGTDGDTDVPGDTGLRDAADGDGDAGWNGPGPSRWEKEVALPNSCNSDSPEVLVLDESDNLDEALNRDDKRIFCIKPGDYRDQGGNYGLFVNASGTKNERRYLWYYDPGTADDLHPWEMDDPETKNGDERVLLPRTHLRGSYWTFDRLRFADGLVLDQGAEHNVLNRLMFYRRDLDTTSGAVSLKLKNSDHNTIQNTVIGRSESGYDCGHGSGSVGVEILGAGHSTIVGNEIFDMYCEDLIQAAQYNDEPRIRGTVIADNDLYLTSAYAGKKPVENAIDLKAGPAEEGSSSLEGVQKSEWTRIVGNRIWNWRGGGDTWQDRYGPTGPVTVYHVSTTSGIIFRGNVVWNSPQRAHLVITNTQKSTKNHHFVAEGNLIWETGGGFEPQGADDSRYVRNVFVDVGNDEYAAWQWGDQDEPAERNVVRNNVFIRSDVESPTLADQQNEVSANAFYASEPFQQTTAETIVENDAATAAHEDRTIRIRRITDPTTVTIPDARPTDASPHSSWFD